MAKSERVLDFLRVRFFENRGHLIVKATFLRGLGIDPSVCLIFYIRRKVGTRVL